MIRVMIVDDDAVVRLGLFDLLDGDPDIDVVAQANDGLQAIEVATAHRIDVALVDVRMPRMDGITATSRLRALPHPPKVITLTTFDLDENVYNALAAGADGFLLKNTDPAEILRAVHLVASGSAMLPPGRRPPPHRALSRHHPAQGHRGSGPPPANETSSLSSPKARPTPESPPTSPCEKALSKPMSAASSPPSN